jgi:spore coat polysaccharide biosynthesis protein SpsF
MRIVCIIQARMGSTRLPGKVLMDLAGEPVLARVVNRARRATRLAEVVVATSTKSEDNAIAALCEARGWPCFRGSEADVLDRYYQAARVFRADVVVRVTSDCPLIDPEVLDRLIGEFVNRLPTVDYAANFLPRPTYPHGLDAEVMRFDVLERLWRDDTNPAWREHVTLYLLEHPDWFTIHTVSHDVNLSHHRWTVDHAEDLALLRRIFEHFADDRFSWREALDLVGWHPDWEKLNVHLHRP